MVVRDCVSIVTPPSQLNIDNTTTSNTQLVDVGKVETANEGVVALTKGYDAGSLKANNINGIADLIKPPKKVELVDLSINTNNLTRGV